MSRVYNFYAGPSTLPEPVLQQIQQEIVDYHGEGLSIIEASHRSPMYEEVHEKTVESLRSLLGVPENYTILLLGGGATLQFSMVPYSFLRPAKHCDLALSGSWAKKAQADAKVFGDVNIVYDGSANGFTSLPDPEEVTASNGAAYLHLTSNETIGGVQWKSFPKSDTVPIVADMSSDIAGRRIKVQDFGLIYAGAQKNIGPAGATVVIIRRDMLNKVPKDTPAYLNYNVHAEKNSLYNTPPVFSIYAMSLTLDWLQQQGGVSGIQRRNEKKASLIYETIDGSDGFYRCPVDEHARSIMNVVFRLPTEEMEAAFIGEAKRKGMIGLKGHRSVGGCRASLYNAMPLEGAEALAAFMKEFQDKYS